MFLIRQVYLEKRYMPEISRVMEKTTNLGPR